MRFKTRSAASLIAGLLSSVGLSASEKIGDHFWPTPNNAFVEGRTLEHFVQPTESGKLISALWGCVRNNGTRFHEGIDLKATQEDRHGESTDSVFAFDKGIVRYVNLDSRLSSYGRYIVIEHPHWSPGMVTLYAHLRVVPNAIRSGVEVKGGQPIATMGRSASYTIPRSRAHLHFEIGIWLGGGFQRWYDQQRFNDRNDHGEFNGMNIIGMDVWAILQALKRGEVTNVVEYLAAEPAAVSVTHWDSQIPDLLKVNPELMTNYVIPENHAGWRIDFSASGLPLRFEALASKTRALNRTTIRIVNERLARSQSCLSLISEGRFPAPSAKLNGILQRLFVD